MPERKTRIAVLSTIIVMALLSGCGQTGDEGIQGESAYWERGKPGGSLSFAVDGEIVGFNLFYGDESQVDLLVGYLVFAAPLRKHPITGDWEGQLAESWECIEDMRGLRITLREGLKWSDGTALDAEDIVRSLRDVYLHPESDSFLKEMVTEYDLIVEVAKENNLTFTIILDRPHFWLMRLAWFFPYPNELVESKSWEEISMLWTGEDELPVTSGPFKVESYIAGESIKLTANKDYFLRDEWGQRLPYLEKLEIVMGAVDDHVADFNPGKPGLVAGLFSELEPLLDDSESGLFTYDFDIRNGSSFVVFNMNPKESEDDTGIEPPKLSWLQERKFRQAVAALLDRGRINRELFAGNGVINYTFSKPGSQHLSESIEEYYIRYDPSRAAELLDELEYIDRDGDGFREDPEGNVIELEIGTNYPNENRIKTAEILAEEAKHVGIRLAAVPDDFGKIANKLTQTHDFDLIILGFAYPIWDMWYFRKVIQSKGRMHASYPNQDAPYYDWEKEVDRLWAESDAMPDATVRRGILEEIQRIWLFECPIVFTVDERFLYVSSVELGNMTMDTTNSEAPYFERMYLQ